MIPVLLLIVSALCGMVFGYAAQRGSICAVRGVEDVIGKRSPRQMLAFLRCSVWVVAITVPFVWIDRSAHLAMPHLPGFPAIAGGFMFGVGAALNGSCSFGTIIRLGSGDLSFIATLTGMVVGFWLQAKIGAPAMRGVGDSLLETPSWTGAAILFAVLIFVGREAWRLKLRGPDASGWEPERAVALMGMAGGLLYALHGSWTYTAVLQGAAMAHGAGIAPVLILIFLSSILGAAIAAERGRRFRLRSNLVSVPKRLVGGFIMGSAAAYVPGGNDALLLHAAPAASPHTLLAYPALLLGITAAILGSRAVRSRTPIVDRLSTKSWKTSGRE